MPTPGRPERSGLCEDDDPGIFGYFPSMESTSPGGETSPVLRQKSGPRDGQKANFKRRAGSSRPTAGRPYDPRTLHGVGNESNGAPGKAEGVVGERRSRKVSELSPFRRKRGIRRRRRRCRGGCPHPPALWRAGSSRPTHRITERFVGQGLCPCRPVDGGRMRTSAPTELQQRTLYAVQAAFFALFCKKGRNRNSGP